jgi:hypothetical protein
MQVESFGGHIGGNQNAWDQAQDRLAAAAYGKRMKPVEHGLAGGAPRPNACSLAGAPRDRAIGQSVPQIAHGLARSREDN